MICFDHAHYWPDQFMRVSSVPDIEWKLCLNIWTNSLHIHYLFIEFWCTYARTRIRV